METHLKVTRIKIPHLPECYPNGKRICPNPFRQEVPQRRISFRNGQALSSGQSPRPKFGNVSKIRHKSSILGSRSCATEQHPEFGLHVAEIKLTHLKNIRN